MELFLYGFFGVLGFIVFLGLSDILTAWAAAIHPMFGFVVGIFWFAIFIGVLSWALSDL